jgi:DNA processing protein
MDTAERAAWLRLTLTPALGAAAVRQLLQTFGLPTAIFSAGFGALSRVLPESLARVLAGPCDATIERTIAATETWLAASPTHALLTLADAAYPRALLSIADPPPLLYASGRVELLQRPALAIVGSRSATRQGVENAEAFAGALARAGITIVSGLALGIDTAAHRGALAALDDGADAATIGVVGTGIDIIYPTANTVLTKTIRERGLVISEFPLGMPPLGTNFPRRNRLISGLARGVLVVEAALRSGSLITARQAAEQGREVFAIPGSIHSPQAKGCHRLIKDGAKLVEVAADILEELQVRGVPAAAPVAAAEESLPLAQQTLLDALGFDPVDLDRLAARTERDTGSLTADLLALELARYVERLPGNRYQRVR